MQNACAAEVDVGDFLESRGSKVVVEKGKLHDFLTDKILSLPDFYRRFWINISFLTTSQQSFNNFFNLVEVTPSRWPLSNFSPDNFTFFFLAKICLCLSATHRNSLQNFVAVAPVSPLDDVNRASIL